MTPAYRWVAALMVMLVAGCGRNRVPCSGNSCLCYTNEDCGSDICFLGSCQSPGYNIQTVWIDLLPNSALGLLQQADAQNPRDLSQGLNFNVTLQGASTLSGQVVAGSQGILGGLLSAQAHIAANTPVVLPSALLQQQTTLGANATFNLGLVPGVYDVTFTPSQMGNPVPSQLLPALSVLTNTQQTINYPDLNLATVTGSLSSLATQVSTVSGAQVSATGVTSSGASVPSTITNTDASGNFSLVFLPGSTSYNVTVRPGTGSQGNALVPTMTFSGLTSQGSGPAKLAPIILDEPAEGISVTTTVKDSSGTPVSGATVFFDGTVGSGTVVGTFSTNALTNSGGQAQTTLLAGTYQVDVVPTTDQTIASVTTQLCVVSNSTTTAAPPATCGVIVHNGDTVPLTTGAKIGVTGHVYSHSGSPVANARVLWAPTTNSSRRQFTALSASDGSYAGQIDPASPGEGTIDYSVQVEPDPTSGLPRHLEYLKVGTASVVHDIQLFASSFVYGYVYGPTGEPLSGVTLAFYVNQGSATQPLLVGLGQSSAVGEFVIPLPTASSN